MISTEDLAQTLRDEAKSRNIIQDDITSKTLSTAAVTADGAKNGLIYQVTKQIEDVLESGIDPAEWRLECQRVEKKLMIPIQSTSSGNGSLDEFYDRQT